MYDIMQVVTCFMFIMGGAAAASGAYYPLAEGIKEAWAFAPAAAGVWVSALGAWGMVTLGSVDGYRLVDWVVGWMF